MDNKTVILIFEGISNQLLSKWCSSDRLPNFNNLLSNNGGILSTSIIPYEAPNLITAFSGVSPENHGVYSYWHIHNYDYIPKIWNADEIKVPMIWQLDEVKQKSFGLLNLFCTFPPYQVNGNLISYLQQPSLRGCYPKNYIKDLIRKGLKYTSDVFVGLGYGQDNPISGKDKSPRDEYFRLFIETEKARADVAMEMIKECDVMIANFTIVDRLSHFFWQEVETGSPFSDEETLLFKSYLFLDNLLESFLTRLPSNTNFLIFSEIGYGPLINFISINKYLENNNFLKQRKQTINWGNTYAFESVQGSHGININLKERYQKGIVEQKDYEKIRQEIIECLKSLYNPKTSLPMFKSVEEREAVYNGPFCSNAPDIIVEMADERFVPLGDNYWASRVHRTNQSGWHRKDGFWTGYGNFFNGIKKDTTVLDIAPTIHSLICKDKSKSFVGKSILR